MNRPVKLVSYTRFNPQYLKEHNIDIAIDNDLLAFVAYVARVSNPSNQNNIGSSERLIKYLIKHKHWSPFQMATICLVINTTRDISRQILRHKSFDFQEFSQRYADPTEDLGFVEREARLQDTKNRQNSIETDDQLLQKRWMSKQMYVAEMAKESYDWAIENGIAKEQARALLPEGMSKTRLFMNGSIRSWIHFIQVRSDPSTQKEHRIIAVEAANEIAKLFPMIFDFVYNEEPESTPSNSPKVSEWLGL